jgi:hypothetical protein
MIISFSLPRAHDVHSSARKSTHGFLLERQQRKAASAKTDATSPIRGDKAKQCRQNSGDKEVITHELQSPPTQPRYATRASTEGTQNPTTLLQPKKLDTTFETHDDNDDDDDASKSTNHNSDLDSLDDETKHKLALVGRVEIEELEDSEDIATPPKTKSYI